MGEYWTAVDQSVEAIKQALIEHGPLVADVAVYDDWFGYRGGILSHPRQPDESVEDINPQRLQKIFVRTYEDAPQCFEGLLGMQGVGPKTIRALSLLSELVYGVAPSVRDPARYSFAHGGKDGHPYPVDRETYDKSIDILSRAVKKAKLGSREELEALRRMHCVFP